MIRPDAVLRLDHEAPAGLLLELVEPRAAGADQDRGDVRVQLDEERLGSATRHQRRSLRSTSIACVSSETTMPSPAQVGQAIGEDLARPVGHVLARHLDEAERRDLDDVGLRPVALELALQRVLDELAVLRVRHVDEVDDDDPADVAQPQLADDLGDRLEVVLRDRVLEPGAARLARARRRTGRC